MQGEQRPKGEASAYLRAAVVLAAIYVAGRALLPFAGHSAVEVWRLAVGVPLFVVSAVAMAVQATRAGPRRLGWSLIAAGVALYPAGTVLTALFGSTTSAPPIAHAAWLAFYVCAYLGLASLANAAIRPFPSAFLLDGLAAVLALGAALTATATALGAAPYPLWETALGVAYPALDLVLLAYTGWIIAVAPRPVGQVWWRLLGAWGLLLAADLVFVALAAGNDLSDVAIHTAAYPLVALLLARAAHSPAPAAGRLTLDTRTAIALPAGVVAVLIGVLVTVAVHPNDGPAIPLVILALLVLTARVVVIQRVASRLAESRRFERGFDEAGIGMGMADLSGVWTRVNPALARMLGRSAEDLVGRRALDQVEGDPRVAVRELRAQILHGGAGGEPVHVRVAVPGDTRDMVVTGDLVAGDEAPQLFVQVRDVTTERRARNHADVISSISRQALALDDLPELLAQVLPDLRDALGAEFVAWVPLDDATDPMTAPHSERLAPGLLDDVSAGGGILLGSRDEAGVEIADPRAIELGLPALYRNGLTYVSFTRVQPRAAARAVLCVAHEAPPEDAADERTCVATVANVLATAADRAHDERASRHRALHDPLTGLANRALLSAHLAQAIASGRRDGAEVGVLLIDLDRFKLVNDTFGHEVGDALLRAVAERLGRHTRQGDLLARLGGDEFVLVTSRVTDAAEIERVAERIVAALDEPIELGGRELTVDASTGVAILPATIATPDALLREADLAMYRAKRAGGAQWARADAGMRARVEERDALEFDLRRALDEDRLRLVLQPQVALDRCELVGFEALVRWVRPGHGMLYPDAFVPLAASTGLLGPIGDWVLTHGLEALALLPGGAAGTSRLAINLLPAQLGPALPETIDRICAAAGVPARRLQVEVPATLLVTDEAAMDVLERLRDRGVGVVLEDFGTGWTSLAALQRHPVDALKLDRSLVARLPDSEAARTVARSALRLADELGVRVTAAGIEQPSQLAAVRDLGITVAQGNLLATPLAPGEAIDYARTRGWEAVVAS